MKTVTLDLTRYLRKNFAFPRGNELSAWRELLPNHDPERYPVEFRASIAAETYRMATAALLAASWEKTSDGKWYCRSKYTVPRAMSVALRWEGLNRFPVSVVER